MTTSRAGDHSSQPSRRGFLAAGVGAGLAAAALHVASEQAHADEPAFELAELSIADLQDGMKSGKWTARSLAEKYLARIEAIDGKGPALHSVIETNADALKIAEALDKERKEKGLRGPLHGIPVLIKDNIDTADRMATTAGSLALVGSKPPADAFLVKRLREAGVVLLGKTNLSEWANIRCSYSTSGWSGRGGLTKNPYALDRNPSGSSSGSGAAVSASLCAVAVGTETDGSVVSPSSACGIVGLKPTVGLVSRSGVIPISHSQDTAGPMGRTVRDVAILLGALAGIDPDDKASAGEQRPRQHGLYEVPRFQGPEGREDRRGANHFGFQDATDELMDDALEALKHAGAMLIDPADLPNMDKVGEPEMTVLMYELKAGMNAYLARLGPNSPVRTLKDIIDFNEHNKKREMPYFGQDLFHKAQEKGPLTSYEYLEARAKCLRLTAHRGNRRHHGRIQTRCPNRPHDGTGLHDGSGEWRSFPGRQHHLRGRGWIPKHHSARRLCVWPAGRPVVLRPALERRHALETGVCLRTGNEIPQAAAIPADCRIGDPITSKSSRLTILRGRLLISGWRTI